jgi:TetR/AcrR family transcriptional repressor of nem operon
MVDVLTQAWVPTRPKTRRGVATHDRIIEAAADLMFARGVSGTSLDDVRAETGTSKSQLYHYFRDKEDLVRAVIARQTERVLEAQRPELDTVDTFAALARWRDRIVKLQREAGCVGGCPVGSLASELADDDEDARGDLALSFARWESFLASGFAAMRARGKLRSTTSPEDLATAVMSALEGGLLLTKTTRSTRPVELALDMALAHVRSHVPSTAKPRGTQSVRRPASAKDAR